MLLDVFCTANLQGHDATPTWSLGFGTCLPATPQSKLTETKVDDFSDSIRPAIAPGDRTIPKRCMKYSLVDVV